ncbi:MAG: hypothetical protein M0P71_05170 [Melioribacteraceae bacterium]|nr:hypothetical protein [Melioribacteraceae bacterium]
MTYYPILVTIHILFAGIWLANFLSDYILRGYIKNNRMKFGERKFIKLYLNFINIIGIVGSMGILITGIFIVFLNPGFSFFQVTANHWLLTKQVIMVFILFLIGAKVIPAAKKVRIELGENLENSETLKPVVYENLRNLYKLNNVINLLVIINILLALSRHFMG